MRGFTTVRDTGGADFGMKAAVEAGLFEGPRLFISGAPISQTGGHGDFRRRTQTAFECACCSGVAFAARIADGVPEVIKAVRDELRKGADQIKIMVSGGVASQADPLESLQFRVDEIEAAVEEATRWGTYVCAHAYTAEAIARAVAAGVRTIEHGNLIDAPTAKLMAERGAYLVPTLVTYDAMTPARRRITGCRAYSLDKNEIVLEAGAALARTGARGRGQDRLRQRSARPVAERPLPRIPDPRRGDARGRDHPLGDAGQCRDRAPVGQARRDRSPGAFADLLVVDGDPLADLGLLQDQGAHIPAIVKGGVFVKNAL